MPAPSLERMCWRPRESSCEDSVAHLVRSLRTYARIRSLTTGTFNLIVKDRISTPPERREFSPAGDTHVPSRPRNPSTIPCGEKPCQSAHPTEFPLLFHNGKVGLGGAQQPCRDSRPRLSGRAKLDGREFQFSTQQYGLPLHRPFQAARGRKTEN